LAFSFLGDAGKIILSHGLSLVHEDSSSSNLIDLLSNPRSFSLPEGGKFVIGKSNTNQTTVTSMPTVNRKPTITRIVRLNPTGKGPNGSTTQTLKLTPAGVGQVSSTNAPKIIKVTAEQFAALKAGDMNVKACCIFVMSLYS
jgi:hypothetical protein